jgi:hypothetical protein
MSGSKTGNGLILDAIHLMCFLDLATLRKTNAICANKLIQSDYWVCKKYPMPMNQRTFPPPDFQWELLRPYVQSFHLLDLPIRPLESEFVPSEDRGEEYRLLQIGDVPANATTVAK